MPDDGLPHNSNISRRALEALHEGAFGWALSLCGHEPAGAEEVIQQTYLLLVEGGARYDGRSTLKTWLYGVVKNVSRRHHRRHRFDLALVSKLGDEPAGAVHDVAAIDAEIDAETDRDQIRLAVEKAISQLPGRQREVLQLVTYSDFTIKQTAEVLGVSVGSARTHYHRAKLALRSHLEDLND